MNPAQRETNACDRIRNKAFGQSIAYMHALQLYAHDLCKASFDWLLAEMLNEYGR